MYLNFRIVYSVYIAATNQRSSIFLNRTKYLFRSKTRNSIGPSLFPIITTRQKWKCETPPSVFCTKLKTGTLTRSINRIIFRFFFVPVVHVRVVEPQIRSAGPKEQEEQMGERATQEAWKYGMKIALSFQIVPDLAPRGDEGRVSLVGRERGVRVRVDELLAAVRRGWGGLGGAHGGSRRGRRSGSGEGPRV